jgi:hypothetical protein
MLKRSLLCLAAFAAILPFLALTANTATAYFQGAQWTPTALQKSISDLGYEAKNISDDADAPKYEFMITRGGLDIYVSAEISGSKSYIWLTVNLGSAPGSASSKNNDLLKQNAKIQPSQFYVSDSGKLMMGLPIDNRGMTNTIFRARVDMIVDSVVSTKEYWQ